MPKRVITGADLLPYADYAARRKELRVAMAAIKRNRRVEVGPLATFYFENWETVRHQIQEMLHIEKGGEAQLKDEIEAYGPLIPVGNDLVATVMFEIDDPIRRKAVLSRIGGIEHHAYIQVGQSKVRGTADPDRENTSPDGKASSVQFLHFTLPPAEIAAFKTPGTQILVGFDHVNYGHAAVVPEAVRAALAGDLD
jgi:hypothetical protein